MWTVYLKESRVFLSGKTGTVGLEKRERETLLKFHATLEDVFALEGFLETECNLFILKRCKRNDTVTDFAEICQYFIVPNESNDDSFYSCGWKIIDNRYLFKCE